MYVSSPQSSIHHLTITAQFCYLSTNGAQNTYGVLCCVSVLTLHVCAAAASVVGVSLFFNADEQCKKVFHEMLLLQLPAFVILPQFAH